MACADKQKAWVHVRPHRKRVWKCFDENPQKKRGKKITRPLMWQILSGPQVTGEARGRKTNLNLKESN